MLVSYHWLKKFAEISATPQEVADKLTLSLSEVESLEKRGDDTILEIENKGLTHRPDCFSHLGIAREVAAMFEAKFHDPLFDLAKSRFSLETELPIKIKVKNPKLCPRYCAIVLTGLRVGESPKWMKTGLTNCGIRPINNIVDITNYVMLELGQPLHAFDYEKIADRKIIVRLARGGEKLTTIDRIEHKLDTDNLVIADAKKPIGLAGIMGGANTEVSLATKTTVLESANFESRNNRMTSKNLKLRTEASTRFEKNLDVNLPLPALKKAVELLKELCQAKVASKLIDIQSKKASPLTIKVSPTWINKFLGLTLSSSEMAKILRSLQIETLAKDDLLIFTVPTFRKDLTMEADIAEEIARIYGYDKIPITLPVGETKPPPSNLSLRWEKVIKQFLRGAGFTEVFTKPFVGKELLQKCKIGVGDHLRLVNPLSPEREFMRQTLIPSLLEVTKNNLRFFDRFKIFELARIYLPTKKVPFEQKRLVGLAVGEDFFATKGIVEALLGELGIRDVTFSPLSSHQLPFVSLWNQEGLVVIGSRSKIVGLLGEIRTQILRAFKIESKVVAFDLDFEALAKLATTEKTYHPIPQFPPIIEDLSLIVDKKTPVGEVMEAINQLSVISYQLSVELIDVYESGKLKKQDKKSLTFRIQYQAPDRQLSDKDVRPIREKIEKELERKFRAKVRKK